MLRKIFAYTFLKPLKVEVVRFVEYSSGNDLNRFVGFNGYVGAIGKPKKDKYLC